MTDWTNPRFLVGNRKLGITECYLRGQGADPTYAVVEDGGTVISGRNWEYTLAFYLELDRKLLDQAHPPRGANPYLSDPNWTPRFG